MTDRTKKALNWAAIAGVAGFGSFASNVLTNALNFNSSWTLMKYTVPQTESRSIKTASEVAEVKTSVVGLEYRQDRLSDSIKTLYTEP